MAVDAAIKALRLKIQQNLIKQEDGTDSEERWLAPADLAPNTLWLQLLRLSEMLSGNDASEGQRNSCKVLLILLWTNCNENDLRRLQAQVSRNNGMRDSDLPVERQRALDDFGAVLGDVFYRKQFIFCPVVLHENKEIAYSGEARQHCPLPFEKREKMGSDSSGIVYKVKVIRGHFYPKVDWVGPNREVYPPVSDMAITVAYYNIASFLGLERIYAMRRS